MNTEKCIYVYASFSDKIKANTFTAATKGRLLESSWQVSFLEKGKEERKRAHSPCTNWSVLIWYMAKYFSN